MYISFVPSARMKYTFFHFTRWNKSHIHSARMKYTFFHFTRWNKSHIHSARMKYTFFHFTRWNKSHIHSKHLNILYIFQLLLSHTTVISNWKLWSLGVWDNESPLYSKRTEFRSECFPFRTDSSFRRLIKHDVRKVVSLTEMARNLPDGPSSFPADTQRWNNKTLNRRCVNVVCLLGLALPDLLCGYYQMWKVSADGKLMMSYFFFFLSLSLSKNRFGRHFMHEMSRPIFLEIKQNLSKNRPCFSPSTQYLMIRTHNLMWWPAVHSRQGEQQGNYCHSAALVLAWWLLLPWNRMFKQLTLVLLSPAIPCLCKQCRSRSVSFWRNQLIRICTVCH